VYEYEDEPSLERHTRQAEDLTRHALAGHAAMYDVEVIGRRAPIDNFELEVKEEQAAGRRTPTAR
ncbi:MAG: hypothetical protein M3N98_09985, partial [Actinomycetota bacterium]|nr:hypothetical protein [Actinomycetota bacterium]